MADTCKIMDPRFVQEFFLHPRENMKDVAEALNKSISEDNIRSCRSILHVLNNAIETSALREQDLGVLLDLNLLTMIPFFFQALLHHGETPEDEVNKALLAVLDILSAVSKTSLPGKKQLGLFAADLLESVLADRSRGFALRLDAARQVNVFLRQVRGLKNADASVRRNINRAFSSMKRECHSLLASAGDFELQGVTLELIHRLLPLDQRRAFAAECFPDTTLAQLFSSIRDRQFDVGCRCFLNALNEKFGDNRSVISFPCEEAYFGFSRVQKPNYHGLEDFWVDFNFGSKSITLFVLDEMGGLDSQEESDWETVIIGADCVSAYRIQEGDGKVILLLKLYKPVSEFITFLPQNDSHYAKITFDRGLHDLPSVVTRILGPAKSKARCSGAESQASSGKASVATHSIHVSGRTAGVTQVVPTKLPRAIMAGDSEDDEFNRFSQEVVRLSQGSNEDKSAADAAGDEGSQERERGNTNGDGQEHSPTTVIPDTCPPMSQSPTSGADNSSDDSPAVEVGQLSSKRQSATGKAGEAKEQEERASPRRSKRLSARAKRDDSTQRVEEEHGGGASDGGRSAPRDASDSVDRDARERSVLKTSRTVPPRGASRGSASSGDGDDAPSQDDDERRGPNVRSTAVRSARDSGNPARKRDAAPAQSRSEQSKRDESGSSSGEILSGPEQKKYPSAFNVDKRLAAAKERRAGHKLSEPERQSRQTAKQIVFSLGPNGASPPKAAQRSKKSSSALPETGSAQGKPRELMPAKAPPVRAPKSGSQAAAVHRSAADAAVGVTSDSRPVGDDDQGPFRLPTIREEAENTQRDGVDTEAFETRSRRSEASGLHHDNPPTTPDNGLAEERAEGDDQDGTKTNPRGRLPSRGRNPRRDKESSEVEQTGPPARKGSKETSDEVDKRSRKKAAGRNEADGTDDFNDEDKERPSSKRRSAAGVGERDRWSTRRTGERTEDSDEGDERPSNKRRKAALEDKETQTRRKAVKGSGSGTDDLTNDDENQRPSDRRRGIALGDKGAQSKRKVAKRSGRGETDESDDDDDDGEEGQTSAYRRREVPVDDKGARNKRRAAGRTGRGEAEDGSDDDWRPPSNRLGEGRVEEKDGRARRRKAVERAGTGDQDSDGDDRASNKRPRPASKGNSTKHSSAKPEDTTGRGGTDSLDYEDDDTEAFEKPDEFELEMPAGVGEKDAGGVDADPAENDEDIQAVFDSSQEVASDQSTPEQSPPAVERSIQGILGRSHATLSGRFSREPSKRPRGRKERDIDNRSNNSSGDEELAELGAAAYTPPRTHARKKTPLQTDGRSARSAKRTDIDDSGLGMTPGSSKPKRRRSVTVLEEGTTPKRVRRMGRLEITVAKTPSPTGEPSDREGADAELAEEEEEGTDARCVDWSTSGPSKPVPKRSSRVTKKAERSETRTKPAHFSFTPEPREEDEDDDEDGTDGFRVQPKRLFSHETPLTHRMEEVDALDEDSIDADLRREVEVLTESLGSDIIAATQRKNKYFKSFAKRSAKVTFDSMAEIMTSQQKDRKKTIEEFNATFRRLADSVETETKRHAETQEKILATLQQQIKEAANKRMSLEGKVQGLLDIHLAFEGRMKSAQSVEQKAQASVLDRVRQKLEDLQHRSHAAWVKESRSNLRKAIQFFKEAF